MSKKSTSSPERRAASVPEETLAQIHRLRAEGWMMREIAKETGLAVSTVHQKLSGQRRTRRGQVIVTLFAGTRAEVAAERIRKKFGEDFLLALAHAALAPQGEEDTH